MKTSLLEGPTHSSLGLFWWAARNPPVDPKTSFSGKTILITGPTAGLGLEAATKLAALGASTLIFGVRTVEKGKTAKSIIEQRTGCRPDVIQIFQLDMENFASIENFVKEVSLKYPTIHAAVLNAGLSASSHTLSTEGWEMSLQVNVLSSTYLAILLLPILKRSSQSTSQPTHLEFVTSTGHGDVKAANIKDDKNILKRANEKSNFSFMTQYQHSKLLEMWAMRHVAAQTNSSEVIVISSCPGLCRSDLGRDFNSVMRFFNGLFQKFFARSSEQGSRTLVSALTLGTEGHGGFWTNDRIARQGILMTSDEGVAMGNQCWKEILSVLLARNPETESILSGHTEK